MANESTYASISGLVADIYEGALLKIREMAVMPPLVHVFDDQSGMAVRKDAAYTGGTVQDLAETDDMSAQTFTPADAQSLTPALRGAQYFITDLRIASDPFGVQRDASNDLGDMMAEKIDTLLAVDMASMTGGTVGSAGGTISWQNIFAASATLRGLKLPGPYTCVMRPEHWYYLTTVTSPPEITKSPNLLNAFAADWYVGSAFGIDFWIDANITAGTAAVGGMFKRDALGFDSRRAMRIEVQRDASRGGGGYELNMTAVFAHGIWRPTQGIKLVGTSTIA
jgi:hypothetical protein